MELDERIRELVAIGASITANCQPCLRSHVEKAVSCGARPEEVAAAIEKETVSSSWGREGRQAFAVVTMGGEDCLRTGPGPSDNIRLDNPSAAGGA